MRPFFLALLLAGWAGMAVAENEHEREDRQVAEAHGWIFNDLQRALELGRQTGKPLMVVLRCPP